MPWPGTRPPTYKGASPVAGFFARPFQNLTGLEGIGQVLRSLNDTDALVESEDAAGLTDGPHAISCSLLPPKPRINDA